MVVEYSHLYLFVQFIMPARESSLTRAHNDCRTRVEKYFMGLVPSSARQAFSVAFVTSAVVCAFPAAVPLWYILVVTFRPADGWPYLCPADVWYSWKVNVSSARSPVSNITEMKCLGSVNEHWPYLFRLVVFLFPFSFFVFIFVVVVGARLPGSGSYEATTL